jgi:hypothetical protein
MPLATATTVPTSPFAAGRLSARLAAAWAAAPERWQHLVRHVPGERWYLPLDDLVAEGYAVTGSAGAASAWLITWAPGTGLDLHDHGGSAGSLAVVSGVLSERYGRLAPGGSDEPGAGHLQGRLRRRRLRRGSVTTFGPDHVHAVRNEGVEPAVSIHVYVPGLTEMAFYDAPPAARPGVRTHTVPAATPQDQGETR